MQEKLKATGQAGAGVGLRGRVGSLGNDLDSTDMDKKRNSIIDVQSAFGLSKHNLYKTLEMSGYRKVDISISNISHDFKFLYQLA